jgi:hypothetical protein
MSKQGCTFVSVASLAAVGVSVNDRSAPTFAIDAIDPTRILAAAVAISIIHRGSEQMISDRRSVPTIQSADHA